MIVGQYRDNLPRVLLTLSGERGSLTVDCILDTAFDGYLSLPTDVLRRIGADSAGVQRGRMADGTVRLLEAYTVLLDWDGEDREVEALSGGTNALLGSLVFEGHRVSIDAVEGGEVVVEPL